MVMSITSTYEANGISIDDYFFARGTHTDAKLLDVWDMNSTMADLGVSVRFGPLLDRQGKIEESFYKDLDGYCPVGVYVPKKVLDSYQVRPKFRISLRDALDKLEILVFRERATSSKKPRVTEPAF